MAATSPADEDQEARTRDEEDHEARTGDEVQLAHALRHYDEVERGDHNGDDDQEGCRDWNDDDDAGDHSDGEHGDGGPKGSERDLVDTIDMAVEFSTAPDSDMHHYFIILDAADPEVIEQVGGLDPIVDEPMSITWFLTLPTVTRQRNTKIRDPIFDYAQSKIFTSEESSTTVEEL
jgi:hypothetical protein